MTSRRVGYRPRAETLEQRQLLSSTFLPFTGQRDVVYDAHRSMLYIPTDAGSLERYDLSARQLTTPFNIGFVTGGIDVSPDGEFIYATERFATDGVGTLHRIDADTGEMLDMTYPLTDGGRERDVAVAANGDVYLAYEPQYSGGFSKLRRFDVETQTLVDQFENSTGTSPEITVFASLSRSTDGERILLSNLSYYNSWYVSGRLFDGTSNERIATGQRFTTSEGSCVISPDGKSIAFPDEIADDQFQTGHAFPDTLFGYAGAFDPVRSLYYRPVSVGSVQVYDTGTWEQQATISVGSSGVGAIGKATPTNDGVLAVVVKDGLQIITPSATPNISGTPRYARGGVAYPVTVTMRHTLSAVDELYRGTIRFASSDPQAVLPADYTFAPEDHGVHTFSVTFKTDAFSSSLTASDVADPQATHTVTGIGVDGQGPVATLSNEVEPDGYNSPRYFSVQYSDTSPIDGATTGDGDVIVVAPDGTQSPALLSPNSSTINVQSPTRSYFINPPGGSWDAADNGTYHLRLAAGSVTDFVGNPAVSAAEDLSTFEVNIDSKGLGVRPDGATLAAVFAPGTVPDHVIGGTKIRATVLVTNVGKKAATGARTISVRLENPNDPTVEYENGNTFTTRINLAPGKTKRVKVTLDIPTADAGSYLMSPVISPDGVLFGGSLNAPAVQLAEPFVDLRASDIAEPVPLLKVPIARSTVTFTVRNDGNVEGGGTFRFDVYAVLRDDLGPTNELPFRLSLGGGRRSLTLKPGQEKTLSFKLTRYNYVPGYYYVWLEGINDLSQGPSIF